MSSAPSKCVAELFKCIAEVCTSWNLIFLPLESSEEPEETGSSYLLLPVLGSEWAKPCLNRLGAIFWLCCWKWERGSGHFTNPRDVHGHSLFLQNGVFFCLTWKSLPRTLVLFNPKRAGLGEWINNHLIRWRRGLNTESLELRGESLNRFCWAHMPTFLLQLPHPKGYQNKERFS